MQEQSPTSGRFDFKPDDPDSMSPTYVGTFNIYGREFKVVDMNYGGVSPRVSDIMFDVRLKVDDTIVDAHCTWEKTGERIRTVGDGSEGFRAAMANRFRSSADAHYSESRHKIHNQTEQREMRAKADLFESGVTRRQQVVRDIRVIKFMNPFLHFQSPALMQLALGCYAQLAKTSDPLDVLCKHFAVALSLWYKNVDFTFEQAKNAFRCMLVDVYAGQRLDASVKYEYDFDNKTFKMSAKGFTKTLNNLCPKKALPENQSLDSISLAISVLTATIDASNNTDFFISFAQMISYVHKIRTSQDPKYDQVKAYLERWDHARWADKINQRFARVYKGKAGEPAVDVIPMGGRHRRRAAPKRKTYVRTSRTHTARDGTKRTIYTKDGKDYVKRVSRKTKKIRYQRV